MIHMPRGLLHATMCLLHAHVVYAWLAENDNHGTDGPMKLCDAYLLNVLICSTHFPNGDSDWRGQAITHKVVDLGWHGGSEQQGLSVWSDLPHNAPHLGTDRHTLCHCCMTITMTLLIVQSSR